MYVNLILRMITLILIIISYGCGNEGKAPNDNSITTEQKELLQQLKNSIEVWAFTCEYNGLVYPCFEKHGDGDQMLFQGLLASSGDITQCEAVFASQDETGRLWRAPSRVNNQTENSFSRDMLLGYLLCLVETKNTDSAEIFLEFLYDNNFKLCNDAKDDRCNLTPLIYRTIWGEMLRVWKYIGLDPTFEMKQGDIGDDHLLKVYSEFAPQLIGFNLHLVGTELLIRRQLNTWTNILQNAANKIKDTQNQNPYFEYVANGRSKRAAELTLKYCPSNKPISASQWMWQREQLNSDWNQSNGWDCIMMINFLLGE